MTTKQWRRAFAAEFSDVRIASLENEPNRFTLHVAFSIERDKLPWPNNAELAVWNLSDQTRDKLTAAGPVVAKVSAGYVGDVNQLFFGVLDVVDHIKDGTDWVTRMSASDCGKKIKEARVSQNFVKGTSFLDIIRAILKTIGLGEGNLSSFKNDPDVLQKLAHGSTLHGNAVEELAYFLHFCNLEFSIQDGRIQFLKIGEGAPNLQGPLISASTGMVGSPRLVREEANELTRKRDGKGKGKGKGKNTVETVLGDLVDMITTVEGECLLNGKLQPGIAFKIESETTTGEYLACATKHAGDTHANDWTTAFKGMPLAEP